jgi:hypothetical protein
MGALREQDSLVEFLLLAAGRSRKRAPGSAGGEPKPAAPIRSPLHRPGAWPAGTRSDIPTCDPGCDCALTHRPDASEQSAA